MDQEPDEGAGGRGPDGVRRLIAEPHGVRACARRRYRAKTVGSSGGAVQDRNRIGLLARSITASRGDECSDGYGDGTGVGVRDGDGVGPAIRVRDGDGDGTGVGVREGDRVREWDGDGTGVGVRDGDFVHEGDGDGVGPGIRVRDGDGVGPGIRVRDGDGVGPGIRVRDRDAVHAGDRDGTGVGATPGCCGDSLPDRVPEIRCGTTAASVATSATAAAAASGVTARRRVKCALSRSGPRRVTACSSNGRTVSGRTVCAALR